MLHNPHLQTMRLQLRLVDLEPNLLFCPEMKLIRKATEITIKSISMKRTRTKFNKHLKKKKRLYLLISLQYLLLSIVLTLSCCQDSNTIAQKKMPNVQSYEEKRNQLILDNKKESFDADITLSDKELRLEEKLIILREEFEHTLKHNKVSFYNQPFLKVKPLIDTTSLYQVFKTMPKGGLLHSHSIGLTDIAWVINTAKDTPECYVYTKQDNDLYLYGQLGIFQENKVPDGFVNLNEKIESNPEFTKELSGLLILKRESLSESIDHWAEFEKGFNRIRDLINYRPFFQKYYRQAFLDLLEDNIQHVEVRMIFENLYDFETTSYPQETIITDIQEIVSEIQRHKPKFTANLIYTSLKFLSIEEIDQQIIQAFEFKKKFPDMITGFDLVAEEDSGNSISYYHKSWEKLASLELEYGVELPLFLHAGESKSIKNTNLLDVVLLNNKRIGHGFNLVLFPQILKQVKEKDMLVELNPISNQVLGFISDFRNHPGRALLQNGVQCSISSDDPAVFGYKGLSYDFWIIFTSWELDLKAIKKLIFNSISYSSLDDNAKKIALQNLTKDWEDFIEQGTLTLDIKN